MFTNIEILSDYPIENVITALHFAVDKIIYFGTDEEIRKNRKSLNSFLKKYCGVKEVSFIALPESFPEKEEKKIREVLEFELKQDNRVFGDISGGKSEYVASFAVAARENDIPLHSYDIRKDLLVERETRDSKKLSEVVPAHRVRLTIPMVIEMLGGAINNRMCKHLFCYEQVGYEPKVEAIWQIFMKYSTIWNPFCTLLLRFSKKSETENPENPCVTFLRSELLSEIEKVNTALDNEQKFRNVLEELRDIGVIGGLTIDDELYSFRYEEEHIPLNLWAAGGIMELHVFINERRTADDCMVGVHLDWDGVLHEEAGQDLQNEIDVITLKGNILTLNSCKSGKMESAQALRALYEISSVAARFGGKYTKKVLYTVNRVEGLYLQRAEADDIEVRVASVTSQSFLK